MTAIQFAEKLISFSLNGWQDIEFQRFGFFFLIGMFVFAMLTYPIKKSIDEFFELRYYQFG
jgi:hypothetical protein